MSPPPVWSVAAVCWFRSTPHAGPRRGPPVSSKALDPSGPPTQRRRPGGREPQPSSAQGESAGERRVVCRRSPGGSGAADASAVASRTPSRSKDGLPVRGAADESPAPSRAASVPGPHDARATRFPLSTPTRCAHRTRSLYDRAPRSRSLRRSSTCSVRGAPPHPVHSTGCARDPA